MAAVKEQRNNERELWWGEAPEWPSKGSQGTWSCAEDGSVGPLQPPSRVPSRAICLRRNPGIGVVVSGLALSWGSVKCWETARRARWHNPSRERRKPGPFANLFPPFGSLARPVHARSRSLSKALASRATKINLATCDSQVSFCSGDIEANSVWPSKSAASRSMKRKRPLPVSSSSFILAFFCFQFSQRSDVAHILLSNWPNPALHLDQFAARSDSDHPGANL